MPCQEKIEVNFIFEFCNVLACFLVDPTQAWRFFKLSFTDGFVHFAHKLLTGTGFNQKLFLGSSLFITDIHYFCGFLVCLSSKVQQRKFSWFIRNFHI